MSASGRGHSVASVPFDAGAGGWLTVAALCAACQATSPSTESPGDGSPSAPDLQLASIPIELAASGQASCPRFSGSGDALVLSWVERLPGPGARLMASRVEDSGGKGLPSLPAEVARGDDWFVNWADVPAVVAGAGGAFAHWLALDPAAPHAYRALWGLVPGLSPGLGPDPSSERLSGPALLHDDASSVEHGFVSALATPAGYFAVWLDGRRTATGGAMALFARAIGEEGLGPELELDERVCSCCPTSAVTLADGSVLVAYRDRSEGEVRDIALVRGRPGRPESWSRPRIAFDDGWVVLGCPVNGPALAAGSERVALAWFTLGKDGEARVQVAFSGDGTEFAWPLRVDDGRPLGRVAVAALPGRDAFVVAWLEQVEEEAQWRLRLFGADARHASLRLADASGERADGFLTLGQGSEHLYACWTDARAESIRLAQLRVGGEGPAHE